MSLLQTSLRWTVLRFLRDPAGLMAHGCCPEFVWTHVARGYNTWYTYIYIYGFVWKYRIPTGRFVWGVCFGGMLRGLLRGYASGYASHVLHHMELTSYLRGFQKTFQPFVYLCVYPCRDVKYLTRAFKMCQGLEVEGLRYETGVIRVWFGYDSRSTIQHTVSDLDRSYNGQSAPEAGRCKRYRLPQWSYSGQSAPKLSSTYLAA